MGRTEQWCGDYLRELGLLDGGVQRISNRENCNSIINKIHFTKETKNKKYHEGKKQSLNRN